MSNVYMAAEPREKHLEYKTDVDTKKYPSEFLWRRNTQRFNVCHNQGRLVYVTQAYITGDIWGYLVKKECTVHITIIFSWLPQNTDYALVSNKDSSQDISESIPTLFFFWEGTLLHHRSSDVNDVTALLSNNLKISFAF